MRNFAVHKPRSNRLKRILHRHKRIDHIGVKVGSPARLDELDRLGM